jgi:hypothetical protein
MEEAHSRAEGPSQGNHAALGLDATQNAQSSAQPLRATQIVEGIQNEQEKSMKTDPRAKVDMPPSDDILARSNNERTSNDAQSQETLAELMNHHRQDGLLHAGTQQGEQSEEEDDEDDVDFNPLFLREDHDEEEEEEEESEEEVAQVKAAYCSQCHKTTLETILNLKAQQGTALCGLSQNQDLSSNVLCNLAS